MSDHPKRLPIDVLERIDALCAKFEDAWQQDEAPSIESVLSHAESAVERDTLLAELLALEMDYRRRRGEQPTPQEYNDRFPEDAEIIRDAWKQGDQPTTASRFEPPTVARLAKLFPALEILELIGAGGMGAVYRAHRRVSIVSSHSRSCRKNLDPTSSSRCDSLGKPVHLLG